MKKHLQRFAVFLVVIVAVAACASPIGISATQPSSSNQVATVVAMTLQALAPTNVPEASMSLLPHSLYFLGNDNQAITQVYRLERDGKTKTQLTFEPVNVTDYDVSLVDGSIAYVVRNQMLLANADGSNHRVLVDGGPQGDNPSVTNPVFSPDGGTLAYSWNGVNLYTISTGVSNLVIADHPLDGSLPPETYSPERYSPDGTKLLITVGYPPDSPSVAAIYSPASNVLMQFVADPESLTCCNFYGGAEWSADSSSFYAVASQYDSSYKFGELWKVGATSGAVTRMLNAGDRTVYLPVEPYLAPDGHLYFFFGKYDVDSGFFDAPVLELVRSAPDNVTDHTVLRTENFRMMAEALWAPDASFVIVATAPARNWDQGGGVLEVYYTDVQRGVVWLAPFGKQMKWGP
jgi:WD40-like Beta Propeller Repeat